MWTSKFSFGNRNLVWTGSAGETTDQLIECSWLNIDTLSSFGFLPLILTQLNKLWCNKTVSEDVTRYGAALWHIRKPSVAARCCCLRGDYSCNSDAVWFEERLLLTNADIKSSVALETLQGRGRCPFRWNTCEVQSFLSFAAATCRWNILLSFYFDSSFRACLQIIILVIK